MGVEAKNVHDVVRRFILADGMHPVFDTEKSHGAYMFDQVSEREFLDLFSFFATQPIAYNHPKLNTDEFQRKLAKVAVHRPTLSDIYTTEFAEFVDVFGRMTSRNHLKHYFFIEGGGLGVENALKAAFDWKVRKNLASGKGEKGKKIIHFKEAFHGRTGYTLSLTNTYDPRKYQYFAHFDWPRIINPKLRFPLTEQSLSQTKEVEEKAILQIQKTLADNPNDIAGLIIEPIQSEGGDNHFRPEFLMKLRSLADENEFLLIFDEVQTGMGITGKMWCWEDLGVKPDLIAFGKKAQIGGCAASDRINEVKDNVFRLSSRINSTWGGNLVDMMRCQKYLEIIEEENLLQNAADVGAYFLRELQKWSEKESRVTNVRGRGLLLAFDLLDSSTRDRMQKTIFQNGAIMLPSGEKSLRIRAHLSFTKANVDHAMEIFAKSIGQL